MRLLRMDFEVRDVCSCGGLTNVAFTRANMQKNNCFDVVVFI